MRYLLGKPDAEPDARDEDEHTALHWACDGGHTEIAQDLIHSGADVNAQNCDGLTPLHMACACEHVAVAKLLINSGASTEIKDEDGSTARELCRAQTLRRRLGCESLHTRASRIWSNAGLAEILVLLTYLMTLMT